MVKAAGNSRLNFVTTKGIVVFLAGKTDWDASVMRWGLVPSWWKDASKLPIQTFNARAGTLAEKPTFRAAFKRRRCLILCDGFYEWKARGEKAKQPFFIHPADPQGILHFAGVWDNWETADGAMESCTIITTEPNALMAGIHNRMPVVLSPEHFDEWLDPANQDTARPQHLLLPCEPALLEAYSVGPVRGDGPELLTPIT